jgi:hypothetical protein
MYGQLRGYVLTHAGRFWTGDGWTHNPNRAEVYTRWEAEIQWHALGQSATVEEV